METFEISVFTVSGSLSGGPLSSIPGETSWQIRRKGIDEPLRKGGALSREKANEAIVAALFELL